MPEGVMEDVKKALADVEYHTGKKFGDASKSAFSFCTFWC